MRFFGKKLPKFTKEEILTKIKDKKDEIIATAAKSENSSNVSSNTLLAIALAVVTGVSSIGMTIRGAKNNPKDVNEKPKVVEEHGNKQEESENIDKYSEVRGHSRVVRENDYKKLKDGGYINIWGCEVPKDELEVYEPYILNADVNIRYNPEAIAGETTNILSTEKAGEIVYIYDEDTSIYNLNDAYDWKKVATCNRDLGAGVRGYIAEPGNARKLNKDEIAELDVKCMIKVKEAPETEIENDVLKANQENENPQVESEETVYEIPANPNRTDCNDSSEVVIDMLNCGDFEGFKTLVDSGKVTACIFSVATTDQFDYFYQHFYDDDPTEYSQYIGTDNQGKLMHDNLCEIEAKYNKHKLSTEPVYKSDKIDGYSIRNLKNMEEYLNYAISKGLKVGFYYYSIAMNNNQASAEAAYLHALYKKLEQDIPGFNNEGVKLPLILDIETGNWRDGILEERTAALEQIVKLLGKGTDAEGTWAIDGVDSKNGYGLIDKNFIFYIDINRFNDYINVDKFKQDMADAGYGMYNWYSRHTDRLPMYGNNGYDYSYLLDANAMLDGILNNKDCVKEYKSVDEAAFLQCDLQQTFANSDYDFSIVPKGNLEKMAKDEKITKFVGDLRNERAVDPQAQEQNQDRDRDD